MKRFNMKYEKLTSFHDGGHGWLRVPIGEIRLAVLQGLRLTSFSFISDKYVYLEEDCDLSAWIEFRQIPREIITQWKSKYSHGLSSIRNYPRFTYPRLAACDCSNSGDPGEGCECIQIEEAAS